MRSLNEVGGESTFWFGYIFPRVFLQPKQLNVQNLHLLHYNLFRDVCCL